MGKEISINLGVVGVGMESLEQYEVLYRFLNYSCHGSIYTCLILHLQNSKLRIKKIWNRKNEMHYWPAESYVVKTFMENILHMPHATCHMFLYHQHIFIYLGKKEASQY